MKLLGLTPEVSFVLALPVSFLPLHPRTYVRGPRESKIETSFEHLRFFQTSQASCHSFEIVLF